MVEERICRICWNTNGWTNPSGRGGKAKSNSFEALCGVGHEEWLFRTDFQIDGFQYGFLQPINQGRQTHAGKNYNLKLWTADGESNTKHWVGRLENVHALTDEEMSDIGYLFKNNGWFKVMLDEAGGLDTYREHPDFEDIKQQIRNNTFFVPNVRFKTSKILKGIFPEPIPVPENDHSITANRYILIKSNIKSKTFIPKPGFDFDAGNINSGPLADIGKRGKTSAQPREPKLSHNKLISAFQEFLQAKYGKKNVRRECPCNGNRVDIVRRTKSGDIFYELKTYNHVEVSLRVAIGQILEYALFPDNEYAKKIMIVSDQPPTSKAVEYINHLKKYLKLSLGFIYFNIEKNEIGLEI